MVEPEKPFACAIQGCGMTFTNEDHLHVHTKKHDMVLQFGMEQKAAFVGKNSFFKRLLIRNALQQQQPQQQTNQNSYVL